ncbi:MAG: murein biosynthesis integral membrane protein MurJ [Candidatus Babeliaceae bacterium]|nr:murein biosynthesis integral membrane protein MurJ [Candidatus Babeliaceae bacterium]
MAGRLTRKTIITKMFQLSVVTFISKIVGFVREVFTARYLGVSGLSDAFWSAFRLPSSLRKIFAEGALSAALVPTLVEVAKRQGKEQASRTMTAMMLVMQLILLAFCTTIAFYSSSVIKLLVPGWACQLGMERCELAGHLLQILIFFIALASAGALFVGLLQVAHSFSIPVVGQLILNLLMIGEWWLYNYYGLPITFIAWAVLANSLVFLFLCIWMFWRNGFHFLWPNKEAWHDIWHVLKKFVPCALGFGAMEISFIVDHMFASYLVEGSMSLLRYTYAFTRLPLQVFGTAFATILLPHFTRIGSYARRRLGFYLFESAKFVWWVTIPATLLMAAFSYQIFNTLFLSAKFTEAHVQESSILLSIFIVGLFFFCFEKVVLNAYYSLHQTFVPTVITVGATILNTTLNPFFMYFWGVRGLLAATVLAEVIKLLTLIFVLQRREQFIFYWQAMGKFILHDTIQLACVGWLFFIVYYICSVIVRHFPGSLADIFYNTFIYWFWVGPLVFGAAVLLFLTRRYFGIRLHFLD